MIFVTAGTQLPFDRLIKAVDEIASALPNTDFVVQALQANYQAKNIKVLSFIPGNEFNAYIDNAELIISHAGMGTIISALVNKKPIIVIPRLFKYKEHRNEHQLGTAKRMDSLGYIHVAYSEQELKEKFNEMWPDNLRIRRTITNEASQELLHSLNTFIKF